MPAPPAASQFPCQFSFPSGELCSCPRCKRCQALEAATMRWLKRGARPSSADGPGRDNHVSRGASRPVHGSGQSPKPLPPGAECPVEAQMPIFHSSGPICQPLAGFAPLRGDGSAVDAVCVHARLVISPGVVLIGSHLDAQPEPNEASKKSCVSTKCN